MSQAREPQTPPPVPADEIHACPYRDEVHRLRRLLDIGLEEQVLVSRRRDRVALTMAAAALGAVLALGGGGLAGGWSLARAVGSSEVRLDQVERRGQSTDAALIQLGRLEAQLEGLEARMGERLSGIERRLERAEERPERPRR